MPDGSPQNTQVWVETDGEYMLVVTAEGRQKVKNVRRDPRVALNVVDPTNAFRIASVRGQVVDVTTEGADQLLDERQRSTSTRTPIRSAKPARYFSP
jgi:PPOX class probable F420-dependent enzyme